MFTPEQLKQIEAYILENLPQILEQDERFVLAVEKIVSEKYATKSELVQVLQEVKALREDMNHRFEALQKEIDRRFEALQREIDRRFEASEQRLEIFRQEVNQRFEAINQRFDGIDTRLDGIDTRLDGMDDRFDQLEQKFDDLKSWIGTVVGGFQDRAGKNLERTMAGMLRVALKNPDIKAETIQLRRKFVDQKGLTGPPGRTRELDILTENDEIVAFEVKSSCDVEDVENFAIKRALLEDEFPGKQVKMILVTLTFRDDIAEACNREDVILAQ